jgi:4-oxalocrotonate tautomerase
MFARTAPDRRLTFASKPASIEAAVKPAGMILAAPADDPVPEKSKETDMPLVDIGIIKNVCTPAEKRKLIERITETIVELEGEALRPVTWVRIYEIEEGDWAIGGTPLMAADIRAKIAGTSS